MARLLFSSMLVIHGMIHLLGFAKEWELDLADSLTAGTLIPVSGHNAKMTGILWLLTSILLLASAASLFLKREWFWIPATAGLILSQALIILYWHEARWGTIGNLVILLAIVFPIASFSFKTMVKNDVDGLIGNCTDDNISITAEKVSKLPAVIIRWLTNSHLIGTEQPTAIRLVQKGSMRTTPAGEWLPFDAEQHITTDPPGFVWNANIHGNAFIDIVGRDKYSNGQGNMLIKAASLFPIADESGAEIDEGALIRFMAEMIWFPQAAVSDYLEWQQLTGLRAQSTMTYRGISASGIFTFNDDGLPVSFEAERFREFKGTFSKEKWHISITGYKSFNGIPIGNTCDVTWKLKDGDFTWLKLKVLEIGQPCKN